jgi:hypothetical protein
VGNYEWFWQASGVYVGERTADLRNFSDASPAVASPASILGDLDAYTTTDLSFGFTRDTWSATFYVTTGFDERAEINKFTNCAEFVCGNGAGADVPGYPHGQVYTVTNQPRTFGIRFSQEF